MIEFLVNAGLSNALLAIPLALLAILLGYQGKRPHLAHLLWLLVFIKLVTPPLVNLPIEFAATTPTFEFAKDGVEAASVALDDATLSATAALSDEPVQASGSVALLPKLLTFWLEYKHWLIGIWLTGIATLLIWTVLRFVRFTKSLEQGTTLAPQDVQRVARSLANQLQLKSLPEILTTSANLSPMVWFTGRKTQVVIPQPVFQKMEEREWRWVLAHELAHAKRRDHLVRWLEWLVSICFWWNPVVWLARNRLRIHEEICCDALVMTCLAPQPDNYANSILTAVESVIHPVRRPAMASEINSGGNLERRIEMIMSGHTSQLGIRTAQLLALTIAFLVIPFGVAHAQNFEKVEKRLSKLVKKGHLSERQAEAMMRTLEEMAEEDEMREDRERERREHRDRDHEHDDYHGEEDDDDEYDESKWEAFGERLKEMVEEGKLTREQAGQQWEEFEKKMKSEREEEKEKERAGDDDDEERAEMSEKDRGVGQRIRMAIRDGKITEEQGRERWQQYLKSRDKTDSPAREDDDEDEERAEMSEKDRGVGQRIRMAIRDGKITEEQGRERWQQYLKSRVKTDSPAKEKKLDLIFEEIKREVAAGNMTREQAMQKMEALKKKSQAGDKVSKDEAIQRMVEDYRAAEKQLSMFVESGKVTQQDAKKRLGEMKNRMNKRLKKVDR